MSKLKKWDIGFGIIGRYLRLEYTIDTKRELQKFTEK